MRFFPCFDLSDKLTACSVWSWTSILPDCVSDLRTHLFDVIEILFEACHRETASIFFCDQLFPSSFERERGHSPTHREIVPFRLHSELSLDSCFRKLQQTGTNLLVDDAGGFVVSCFAVHLVDVFKYLLS